MTVKYLQTKSTGLSYGISRSSTTIQLKQLLKLDGTSVSASDVGDLLYGTFAPGTSREEIFSIVGANVTVESDGKITITSVTRGLKEVSPYTTGGYSCDHPAGEVVIFGNNPQIYQWLKDYIDGAIVSGGVPATDAVPGIVIEGTQAQVDAGTTQETYNAQNYDLFVRPDTLRAKKYHDAIASATGTDAYAITVVPAITAYAIGQEFTFIADVANTTGATLSVCGLTATAIKKDVSTALATGDILAGQVVKVMYDGTSMQLISNSPQIFGDFGDGSDGDVTISGTTTLTSDMYYNNLVVTGTLNTANWRVFVKGTLSGNGTIQCNGGAGGAGGAPTAGAAGAKVADGYFSTLPGYAGAAGQTGDSNGATGNNGAAVSTSIGVVGVAGGSGGSADVFIGGGAGTAGSLTAKLQKFGINKWQTISALDFALNGTPTKYNGSSGSSSGGGGALREFGNNGISGGGGGSGAPGGIIAIFVNNWTGTVGINAQGGAGGAGGAATQVAGTISGGGGGGGAGGSGGVIYVVYKTKTWTGSFSVSGGAGGSGGAGYGTGNAGASGSTGTTGVSYEINIATLL